MIVVHRHGTAENSQADLVTGGRESLGMAEVLKPQSLSPVTHVLQWGHPKGVGCHNFSMFILTNNYYVSPQLVHTTACSIAFQDS